jgi:hypothetical protein
MFRNHLLHQLILIVLLSVSTLSVVNAAADPAACATGDEGCLESCKRFNAGDARRTACNNFCRTNARHCEAQIEGSIAPEPVPTPVTESEPALVLEPESLPEAVVSPTVVAESEPAPAPTQVHEEQSAAVQATQAPTVAVLANKKEMLQELEKNAQMLAAIKAGNLNAIRRLIEVQGLSPTYVYSYDYNAQSRQFEGKATRLRLSDVFADTNTLRNDAAGLDRMLTLFIELGMDVKATLVASVPANESGNVAAVNVARTAWGPSLIRMEAARDRGARLRAFEIALQTGLLPNDDFSEWLFAELPQVCGRDRSKFAIQVVDLLMQHLQPTMGSAIQDFFWRAGEQGPETVADVIDLSFAPPQPKTPREKALFALQDSMWEQCVPLSRRVNRILLLGM